MPNLAVEKEWGGGSVPIKFSAWYDCARDPGGQATYALYVQIKPLSSSWWFGYPINVSAEIRVDNGAWQTLLWPNSATSWMFKDKSPLNWSADIQYNTQNKLITASPGQNVQIKLRIYSNGASDVVDRDKTFTWSNLIVPQLNASQIVSITNLSVTRNGTATISANVYNASQTHTLTVQYSGTTIATRTITWTGSGTLRTYDFVLARTPVDEVARLEAAMPNTNTGVVTYTLTTSAGGTTLGTSSKQGSCTIPDTVRPSTPTVTTSRVWMGGGVDPIPNLYAQKITAVQLSGPSSRPGSGSSITKYRASLTFIRDDESTAVYDYDIAVDDFPYTIPLDDWGAVDMAFTAYDSRGRSSTPHAYTDLLYVRQYNIPQITSYASYRSDISGGDDAEGQYLRAELEVVCSSLDETNSIDVGAGGLTDYRYIVYDNTQYASETTIDGISNGDEATCVMHDPRPTAAGGVPVSIYLNGVLVAGGSGIHYATYDLTITSGVQITYDIADTRWDMLITTGHSVNNTGEIQVEYKQSNAAVWVNAGTFTIDGTIFRAVVSGPFLPEVSYDIRYTISDTITTTGISVEDYLSSAKFTLFLAKGGNAVSVGEVYSPAAGSDEKVLNISDDWVISRGGEPAIRVIGGWTVHYLGDGYVEMWGEVSETIDQWTQWANSDIYYSQYKYHKTYPQLSSSQNNVFATPPIVNATIRTYYTSSSNNPSLWLVGDGHDIVNTDDSQKNHTPYYTIGRVGGGVTASATVCFHVFGKLASS